MTPETRNALRGVVIHMSRMAGRRATRDPWTQRDVVYDDDRFHRDMVGSFIWTRRGAPPRSALRVSGVTAHAGGR